MFPTSSSDVTVADEENRRAELAANLASARDRVRAACEAAGRDPGQVAVIAVTKTWPASDVRLLRGLGMRDFGENRDSEASAKAAACADLDLTWHFVGQLQTNKCRSVARYAGMVHSVDRERLVTALGSAARAAGKVVTGLLQVRLDTVSAGQGPAGHGPAGHGPTGYGPTGYGPTGYGPTGYGPTGYGAPGYDPGRGGAAPDEVEDLARAVDAEPGLRLGGVMGVAPLGRPPEPAFAILAECAAVVRTVRSDATVVSAGMSGDLEAAIAAGATHVRIGTALLGNRTPRVR